MKRSPIALIITLVLFVVWISWLGMQAIRYANPIVVSRAQLLEAQYNVVVELSAEADGKPSPNVQVKSVLGHPADGPAPGQSIQVQNLSKAQGFTGNGMYALPLVKRGSDYFVADMPLDPGFTPSTTNPIPPRIYPWTRDVERQFATSATNQ
jgi:hypothetical protein